MQADSLPTELNLLYDAGSSDLVLCDNLDGWYGMEGGKKVQKRGDIRVPVADSD